MRTATAWVGAAALLAGAGLLVSQSSTPEHVGPRMEGGFLLNSGWILKPAGKQIPLSTFPMASAVSPDGKHLVILQGGYLQPSVSLHDPLTLVEKDRLSLPDAWLGLKFAPSGNVFYVGGGSKSTVFEVAVSDAGKLEKRREFVLVAADKRKHSDFIGDVTLSPDGRLIYAAALHRDSIFVINPQTGIVIEEWKTGHRPYRILFHPDGKSYYVTGWGDGYLYHHNAINGEIIAKYAVGIQPMDMVWRGKAVKTEQDEEAPGYVARLFVAVGGTNQVTVYGVSADKGMRKVETVNVGLYPDRQPVGMTPSALALSPDEDSLYVVCSDANAVAQVDVSSKKSIVMGFIPTGWYPTAARVLSDQSVMVLNGRGSRSFPNPEGPNPTIRKAPVHEGIVAVQYVGAIQNGSASLIPAPTAEMMGTYTENVMKYSPYKGTANAAGPTNLPPIEHVIYVVKENRTYDQVLGNLGIGNGDPSLTLFTEQIAPNHHKLAREFVLLDNFYVNADVSADGHNWSTSAIAPPYVQRMWQNSYSSRRRHYDYEGGERAALPPAGYIWSNALQKGLTVRNYGWWCTNITPAPASGEQILKVRDVSLEPHTNKLYRGFDLGYKDIDRMQVFLKDLAGFEATGKMPSLITMRIGNDHTSGTAAGKISPQSAMADNDQALGMLVEAVSKSRFWGTTAIFVLEDDAQNGPDHVDSHRSPAYVISPYTRGRGIDSTMYNTVSMLRTIEVILGMAPMTMHDAGARVMRAAFKGAPDAAPYVAEKARISLDQRNPASAPTARVRVMDFEEADRNDDGEMNEELWLAMRKTQAPAPVRSLWGK